MTNDELMIRDFLKKRESFLKRFAKSNPEIKFKDLQNRDYRVEYICPHGVGHTVWYYSSKKHKVSSDAIHGCCQMSCCYKLKEVKK